MFQSHHEDKHVSDIPQTPQKSIQQLEDFSQAATAPNSFEKPSQNLQDTNCSIKIDYTLDGKEDTASLKIQALLLDLEQESSFDHQRTTISDSYEIKVIDSNQLESLCQQDRQISCPPQQQYNTDPAAVGQFQVQTLQFNSQIERAIQKTVIGKISMPALHRIGSLGIPAHRHFKTPLSNSGAISSALAASPHNNIEIKKREMKRQLKHENKKVYNLNVANPQNPKNPEVQTENNLGLRSFGTTTNLGKRRTKVNQSEIEPQQSSNITESSQSVQQKSSTCPFPNCGKIYSRKHSLQKHIHQKHEKQSPKYICTEDNCGKSYFDKFALKQHQNQHANFKPFTCNECDKQFTTKGHLNDHVRSIHLKEKQFQCDQCDSVFARKSVLKVHMRKHNGEKPYVCPICQKCFTESGNLNTHKKLHVKNLQLTQILQMKQKDFKCPIQGCDKQFITKSQVKQHLVSKKHKIDLNSLTTQQRLEFQLSIDELDPSFEEDKNDTISENSLSEERQKMIDRITVKINTHLIQMQSQAKPKKEKKKSNQREEETMQFLQELQGEITDQSYVQDPQSVFHQLKEE